MDKLLWLDLNCNPWFLLVLVIVSIAIAFKARATGLLLLSLVLYLGIEWHAWNFVAPVFWTVWGIGTACVVLAALTNGQGRFAKFCAWGIAGVLVASALISGGVNYITSDSKPAAAPKVTPTATATPTQFSCNGKVVDNTCEPGSLTLTEDQLKTFTKDVATVYPGFKPGQVAIGTGQIPSSPREAATSSFTKKTIETRKDLETFYASDDAKAKRMKARLIGNMRKHNLSEQEIQKAVTSGDRWIWLAPKEASTIYGTTFPIDGNIVKEDQGRGVASNDAIWFYVTEDGHLYGDVSVRADCGNGEVTKVVPTGNCKTTGTCPPPISCPPNSTAKKCLTPKVPSQDPNVNDNIPGEHRGPGKTPVGTDPGKPTTPVDTDTGCNGPCPGATHPTQGPSNPSDPEPPATHSTPLDPDPPATGNPVGPGSG